MTARTAPRHPTLSDQINQVLRRVPTWPVYLIAALPPVWLLYSGLTGGLGADPIKALEREMGELGLKLLIASLLVTPLRRFAGINLLRFRRALGLIAFFYIALHLLVWLVLDVQIPSQIIVDIIKRPYVTVGMAGFVLLVPLALTSNNWSIRKLGRRWQNLHKLVYPAILLGAVHFVMLVKGWQVEPLVYLGLCILLVGLRYLPRRRAG
ncbi:protein-methionine-sulfoxide reductase heme-binding subunit MsrQ [Donghicola tyrosinivorans]|uniref:Protein-methionine-sulfoxide reductase heme-binding subunit MsrQ n=1 Tax=Donghicola tyrosinivorans TaxID=1652492 RepID=A0A2T0WYS8_9RHOB|nr:protein-methionine-sulfoxide reductase heme-binding subunit MsrQ [Donghicola tyrosinivorans]PRY91856.1 sulfoxide reductase heme-binding subunit YedZ [Donghicola tyrosinivorans]